MTEITIPAAARLLLAGTGLNASMSCRELAALHIVAANPGISTGPLAAAAGSPKPAMTRAADMLVAAGLMRREEDADDRRKVRLVVTAAGRALIAEHAS